MSKSEVCAFDSLLSAAHVPLAINKFADAENNIFDDSVEGK